MKSVWKTFVWNFCFFVVVISLLYNYIPWDNRWRMLAFFIGLGVVNAMLQLAFRKVVNRRRRDKSLRNSAI